MFMKACRPVQSLMMTLLSLARDHAFGGRKISQAIPRLVTPAAAPFRVLKHGHAVSLRFRETVSAPLQKAAVAVALLLVHSGMASAAKNADSIRLQSPDGKIRVSIQ
ncbi:MAG: hypothetical protein ACTHKU_14995, partial [Verrucomicrobiota bacterium]